MICGLLVTVVAAVLLYYPPELLRFFDYRIYDLLLSGQQNLSVEKRPVVVGIDEESLARFGQWPWPRYRLAQLIKVLQEQGVAAIGVDLLMPEEDRTSPDVILRERRRDLNEKHPPAAWGEKWPKNDQLLAEALAAAPVVLGFKFLAAEDSVADRNPLPKPLPGIVVRSEGGVSMPWAEPAGVLTSLDSLLTAASGSGFVNAVADRDGVVRRVPLLLSYQNNYYPGLALATVLQARHSKQLRFDVMSQETVLSWDGEQIALDRRGNMLLGNTGASAYRYLSAAELLDGQGTFENLNGAVVFVGAVATGLGDRHVTPTERDFPGVKIHAVVASNLLNHSWYSHPVWARGVELLCVLILGVFSAWSFSFFALRLPILLTLVTVFCLAWSSVALFKTWHFFVSPTLPVLVLLLNASLLGLMRYGIAAQHLRRRNKDLLKAQDATIVSLITLAETRDSDTGAHILRTQRFVKALAEQLQKDSSYSDDISSEDVAILFQSAPLHDIGKVGIPDRILMKDGTLTDEEIAVMREHPQLGAMALSCTAEVLEDPESYAFLHYARQMAETHHERWDGSGYPAGLKGDQIPLAGRLMALADVYDALVSDRSYKQSSSHEQARDFIVAKSGELFDPEIVRAFLACEETFAAISQEYRDGDG
jgi:adenylate cyclase